MSCQSCVSSCQCVVIGSPGIVVTGSGAPTTPYLVSPDLCVTINALGEQERIATATDWLVSLDQGGNCVRLRPPPSVDVRITDFTHDLLTGDIEITEADGAIWQINIPPAVAAPPPIGSSCINVTGSTISPIISPDACNGLECRANGLYAVRPRMLQGFLAGGSSIPAGTVVAPGATVCAATTNTITIDNTGCPYPIGGHVQFGIVLLGQGAGSAPVMGYQRILSGGAESGIFRFGGGFQANSTGAPWVMDSERDFFNIVVPGGTSTTFSARVCAENNGVSPYTISSASASVRYWMNVL
jgi:hypothetical protein